jgi:hypothetical protein
LREKEYFVTSGAPGAKAILSHISWMGIR